MIVLGIDPGGATTGLVVVDTRDRDEAGRPAAVRHELVERDGDDLTGYRDAIRWALDLAVDAAATEHGVDLIAVEGLVHPNPHLGLANVRGLIDTARVLGWLDGELDRHPFPTVTVRPGRHGSAPAAAYPPVLIGPREGPKLTGRLRHARSAYDVALAGAHGSRRTA